MTEFRAREVREVWTVSGRPCWEEVGKRGGLEWGGGLMAAGVLAYAVTRKCALPLCGAANEWTCR